MEAAPRFNGPWKVVHTPAFDRWLATLDRERAMRVRAAMGRVATVGPALGRPRVDSVKGSRIHNLKELRLNRGVRVLFAFDPNRQAVMLTGGDKAGRWNRWYPAQVRAAERAYDDHLRALGRGTLGQSQRAAVVRPEARSR